jgi:hypothetical protein
MPLSPDEPPSAHHGAAGFTGGARRPPPGWRHHPISGVLARLVDPRRQRIPIWLTAAIGAIAGTFLAQAVGVAVTPGIDWIELAFQVAIASVGVSVAVDVHRRRSVGR